MRKSKTCELSLTDIIMLFMKELLRGVIEEIFNIPWFFRILYLTHCFA